MSSHPPFKLFNTLTKQLEPLVPSTPGKLRMYSCGPTVYSYAHIGNFRTFLTADLIVRTAHAIGWDTMYVSNITDVGHLTEDDVADAGGEDKMAKALRSKEGEQFANIWDLARYYTHALVADWQALNMHEPDVRPRATEHITQQIEAIQQLIDKGHAYETTNAVYFDVNSFKEYGKLSGNKSEDNLNAAVRDIVVDPDKKSPRDFALWKKDNKHLMQWYSPFGRGFPGWHIECSVMSMHYLGDHFDLHGGGEDLIFPHHECEIAQAEGVSGETFADMWVHTRFLQVEGEKMSKSKGNFFTVRDLTGPESGGGKGVDPFALRLALISGHYRKPFNFTFKNLRDCVRNVERFRNAEELAAQAIDHNDAGDDHLGERLADTYQRALSAMLDDLNTPLAIAAALEGARLISGFKNLNGASAKSAARWLDDINSLLGLYKYDNGATPITEEEIAPLTERVEQLLEDRQAARNARDWTRADAIRDELDDMGIEIMDTPEGQKWTRKTGI